TWIDGNTYTNSNSSATHILTNSQGCDSLVSLNLTITTADVSVTNNDPSLTANASGAAFQWVDCDNGFATIPNATMQTFTPTNNGNYAVIVTQNACSDTSMCNLIETLGTVENSLSSTSIHPNPTNGPLTVLFEGDEAKLIIYDFKGTVLEHLTITSGQVISLTEYKSGCYFIRLSLDGLISTEKVIKF
ncbi:MAG: T9SS type A sorting domain-containing protein, partial [Crocinitomicaceae bacterium]